MSVNTDAFFDSFCREVLQTDHFIRFAGLCDHVGHMLATVYRPRLVPLMTEEETKRYAVQAAIRMATRNSFDAQIGELKFSIARYSKLVRATIPIRSSGNNRFLLLLTFDVDAEADSIVNKKVLPFVKDRMDYFM